MASTPNPVAVVGFWPEHIERLSDPYADLAITITGVTEDKPVKRHKGSICANAFGVGSDTAWVRLETGGPGGMLYRIAFNASDQRNARANCAGKVTVCVQDAGRAGQCVDTGQTYDATKCPTQRHGAGVVYEKE